jgi:hypothetical protein
MARWTHILIAVSLLAAFAAPLGAQEKANDETSGLHRPPAGSIAAQLRLRFRLLRQSSGTLTAALDHNLEAWRALSPDQRENFRRKTLAYLEKNPEDRRKIEEIYRNYLSEMSPKRREAFVRRAKWLDVVIKSFSAAERKELLKLSPTERARRLHDRKREMIKSGELRIETPEPARGEQDDAPATEDTEYTESPTQPAS